MLCSYQQKTDFLHSLASPQALLEIQESLLYPLRVPRRGALVYIYGVMRYLKPKTRPGLYSLAALAGTLLFLVLLNVLVALGQEGPDINYFLLVPAVCGYLFGMLALGFGSYSIIRQGERAVPVMIATLIGLLLLIFAVGEILIPH